MQYCSRCVFFFGVLLDFRPLPLYRKGQSSFEALEAGCMKLQLLQMKRCMCIHRRQPTVNVVLSVLMVETVVGG